MRLRWIGVALLSGVVLAVALNDRLRNRATAQLKLLIGAKPGSGIDAGALADAGDETLSGIRDGFKRLSEICTTKDCSNPEEWI